MAIQVGDKLPAVTLKHQTSEGIEDISTEELCSGNTVVIFGLPGAFTPTCSAKHLPSFIQHAAEIKAKGVHTIACLSVNDAFVMGAWGKDQGAGDAVLMLADGNAELSQALGLEMDASGFGMGLRCQRFAMVIEDGVVKALNVEAPGAYDVSSAEAILATL